MNYKLEDIILSSEDDSSTIKGILDAKNNTIWTTQKAMAEYFKKDVTTINSHINNIFKSNELVKEEVTFNPNDSRFGKKIIVNPDSKKQPILYNLDTLISVGYRVRSKQAIKFRRWAIKIISQYIIKGFALDVESLKYDGLFGVSYFSELVESVNEIKSYIK